MCRRLALIFGVCALVSGVRAQSPASASDLRPRAPLAVVDVVVVDPTGRPVRGLKAQNFRVSEGGVAQTPVRVEEHSSQATPANDAVHPPELPGIFSDYTPIAPGATLNILLIDALNTPVKDEAFIRHELQQYAEHANPQTRIAVFGLANRPIVLQGFTSNPGVLRDVIERKLISRSSSVVHTGDETTADRSTPSAAVPTSNSSPSALEIAANLREFQSELGEMETELRAQYTLDAFNTLAHYLAAFPGRKNLIWFSGSFPLTILPDPLRTRPSDVSTMDAEEFRETVNLLAQARVAVYPIDARALMTEAAVDAAKPEPPGHTHRVSADLAKSIQTDATEHARMDELAMSTGGRAFYDSNNLADAVNTAVATGSEYYTLNYTPSAVKQDGAYRPVLVETAGVDAAQTLRLSYRHGFYTDDASHPSKPNQPDSSSATPESARSAAYKHAAMSRGAPTPEDMVFKVRVQPAASTTETSPAPNNQLALSVPANGPFRRYELDYISLPGELTFTRQPDGRRTAKVEFLAYVYDTEGRLLDETGKGISLEATPANLANLFHSVLRCHLELSVPDRAETFLRIGVRDVSSNKFGVIEVPASSVSQLPVATHPPAPTSGRPTPPQD
jgi:VWFA-related protein